MWPSYLDIRHRLRGHFVWCRLLIRLQRRVFFRGLPDNNEDILYCVDNPYGDEVMYDADVSCDTNDASLLSVDDPGEEDSFSSGTFTLILNPGGDMSLKTVPHHTICHRPVTYKKGA